MDYGLIQRRAFVTGAGRGIGRAVAIALAREGADVALVGRTATALDCVADEIRQGGGKAVALQHDLGQDDPAPLAEAARPALGGPIEIVVICHASFLPMGKLHSVSYADMQTALTTDVQANWRLLQSLLPDMMGQRFGRVVLVGSLSAHMGQGKAPIYCTVKGAMEGLARNLAIDFGRFGITTNVVSPGFVATERLEKRADENQRERLRQATANRALATADQVANAIAFLCSDGAGYVNGAILPVTGGAHLANLW